MDRKGKAPVPVQAKQLAPRTLSMGFLHPYMHQTCPEKLDQFIGNLTSSYTDKKNEPTMASASVIMFVLAGVFFNLNLFSGISDISAILDPRVRRFLTSALSVVLPVMSYLFSEAKNAVPMEWMGPTGAESRGDLSVKAGLILAWMLLVELLRKKVDEVRMRGYSGSFMRAGRVIWLGNLVLFNIKSAGRKAVFVILWILCATRVVQRIAFTELGKRSYEHGKNPRLISSCMAQIMLKQPKEHHHHGSMVMGDGDVEEQAVGHLQQDDGNNELLLRSCEYIVKGEARLVKEATADGYQLAGDDDQSVVRVGKVWNLAETDGLLISLDAGQRKRLKGLCLSFALFKLLRRRFEHVPALAADEEARDCRDLIFKDGGLVGQRDADESAAESLIQVVYDEVNFLSEYHHSVVPVALASPSFLVVNYFFVLAVVALLCLMAVILCGNGDAGYAFRSIADDEYVLRFGIGKLAACIFSKAVQSPSAFFSALDLAITALLFAIYLYEEVWEFFIFLFSNWFMVSLLASYTSKERWCSNNLSFRLAFRGLIRMRSTLNHPRLSFRQVSALNLRWPLSWLPFLPSPFFGLREELVPKEVKKSIIDYLAKHARGIGTEDYTPLSNGSNALRSLSSRFESLSSACESSSVAEVILTWHIATSIMEEEKHAAEAETTRRVAISLSKYCAYLVAFHPELLPDYPEKAKAVVEDMKQELQDMLPCWDYYLSPLSERVNKIKEKATTSRDKEGVVRKGAELATNLPSEAKWEVLAAVWTELLVFVAPSSDEEVVKAHEDVLVQGGEFITVLWALTTHTGISRPANKHTAAWGGRPRTLQDLFGDSMRER